MMMVMVMVMFFSPTALEITQIDKRRTKLYCYWDQAEVGVDFEQPDFGRQASDFENASQIYSTKQRLDIKFVDKRQIERILEQRIA